MASVDGLSLEFSDNRTVPDGLEAINNALHNIGAGSWPLDLQDRPADIRALLAKPTLDDAETETCHSPLPDAKGAVAADRGPSGAHAGGCRRGSTRHVRRQSGPPLPAVASGPKGCGLHQVRSIPCEWRNRRHGYRRSLPNALGQWICRASATRRRQHIDLEAGLPRRAARMAGNLQRSPPAYRQPQFGHTGFQAAGPSLRCPEWTSTYTEDQWQVRMDTPRAMMDLNITKRRDHDGW